VRRRTLVCPQASLVLALVTACSADSDEGAQARQQAQVIQPLPDAAAAEGSATSDGASDGALGDAPFNDGAPADATDDANPDAGSGGSGGSGGGGGSDVSGVGGSSATGGSATGGGATPSDASAADGSGTGGGGSGGGAGSGGEGGGADGGDTGGAGGSDDSGAGTGGTTGPSDASADSVPSGPASGDASNAFDATSGQGGSGGSGGGGGTPPPRLILVRAQVALLFNHLTVFWDDDGDGLPRTYPLQDYVSYGRSHGSPDLNCPGTMMGSEQIANVVISVTQLACLREWVAQNECLGEYDSAGWPGTNSNGAARAVLDCCGLTGVATSAGVNTVAYPGWNHPPGSVCVP
jgi:hypothetical protein